MSDLQSYLDVAASAKVQTILRGQYKAAAETGSIKCPCGQPRAIRMAYRCLYCGIYFCERCAERHFGETRAERYERRKKRQINDVS